MEKAVKVKIVTPSIINPFFWYAVTWTLSLYLYNISKSRLNIPLALGTKEFIASTIIISIALAIGVNLYLKNKEATIKYIEPSTIGVCFLWVLYLADFLYSRTVPLFSHLYKNFGFPTLHVISVTFGTYYCIRSIFQFLIFKEKKDIKVATIILLYYVLIFSRGLIVFILIASILPYIATKRISFKQVAIIVMVAIVGAWVYGIVGNIRSGMDWNDSGLILGVAEIKANRFSLTAPFYWVDEYLINSLRNLNYNIAQVPVNNSFSGFIYFFIPDFISKRLVSSIPQGAVLVKEEFTTTTMYGNLYACSGYLGMIINYITYAICGLIAILAKTKNSLFKFLGMAIMSFLFMLSMFDNMLWYSGFSFALVWIVIVALFKPYLYKVIIKA